MAAVIELLILNDPNPPSVAEAFDVFQTANRLCRQAARPDAFALRTIGPGAARARTLVGGDDAVGEADLVVMPGLGVATEEELSQRMRRRDVAEACEMLVEADARGASIAAACSSVFILAAAGLLDGRRATTSWWLAPLFRQMFPQIELDVDKTVVADGVLVTAGPAAGHLDLGLLDFALTLIARHAGRELAESCARELMFDRRAGQSQLVAANLLTGADDHIARAELWAQGRLGSPMTVEELAGIAALSPRTFARRVKGLTGLSPARLLQRLRVERAVRLIETTNMPFDDVARSVGYADTSTLRRLLRGQLGRTPGELRRTNTPR